MSNRKIYKLDSKYKNWRSKVLSRDKYKCQMPGCNCKKRLQAHHIRRWADCVLTRYEVSNGITLCRACHDRIHNHETAYMLLFTRIVIENESKNSKR
jgi:hypothetical protein